MFSNKYHRFFIVVIALLLAIGSTFSVYAADKPTNPYAGGSFYISASNGSDQNAGSQAEPWRTIQKAANDMPSGGKVIVLEGNYPERVTVSRSNLSFQAQGEVTMQGFKIVADNISISGFTITSLVDDFSKGVGILVAEGGNCLIENNSLLYNTWGGVRLLGDTSDPNATHDCTIRNNTFVRNGLYAAEIKGVNHLIEGNDVSNSIQHHPCSSSTASWLDADAFRFHGRGHIFRDNYIHDIPFGQSGFDQTACNIAALSNLSNDYVSDSHTDCFQTYGGDEDIAGHDILFENNRCELPLANEWVDGAGAKAFQGSGNTYNLTFRNNLVVADLISLFSDGCHDLTFIQNTFVGSGHTYSQGLQFEGCSGTNTIKNNVFYRQENGIGHIWPVNTQVNAGYNCIYNASGTPSRPADPGDVWDVDPLLKSDYSLSANSPCIDAGANLGINTDFNGNPRPQGAGPDMGAFEFEQLSSQPPTVESIIRVDTSPTGSSNVRYDVTFSQPVTGVDMGDFSLTTSGDVSGASIINLSGSGKNYTVSVDTGAGNGTIRLDLTSNSIVNENGDPLSGAGSVYFEGEVYTIEKSPAPENDDFAFAKDLTTVASTDFLNTQGATLAGDDPDVSSCGVGMDIATVWYKYTPSSNAAISLDTSDADYDTFIAVWTGTRGNLSLVACNDDAGEALQAIVALRVTKNTTYYIEIGQSVK